MTQDHMIVPEFLPAQCYYITILLHYILLSDLTRLPRLDIPQTLYMAASRVSGSPPDEKMYPAATMAARRRSLTHPQCPRRAAIRPTPENPAPLPHARPKSRSTPGSRARPKSLRTPLLDVVGLQLAALPPSS